MITREMIEEGYEKGLISLINSPNEDGIVCAIGDNWFYFEKEAEYFESVKEYKESIPKEDIIKSIFKTLNDFQSCGFVELQDEIEYYEAFLNEHGIGLDEECIEY